MPSGNGAAYQVSFMPAAESQLLELGLRAVQRGAQQQLMQTLQRLTAKLATRPLKLGEPAYHPKKLGSVVCHASYGGLLVEYALFELERVVIVLNVKPLSGSPWDS